MSHPHVSPVGRTGRLVLATRGTDGPGEVLIGIPAATETFTAYSRKPLPVGQTVLCIAQRGHRSVDVELWLEPTP